MTTTSWKASLIEQRTAWGVAFSSILIIAMTTSWPQWFEFSVMHERQISIADKTPSIAKAVQPTHTTNSVKPPIKKQNQTILSKPVTNSTKHQTSHLKTPNMAKGFYIQIGAFKERERAQRLSNQLKRKGWSVHVVSRKAGLHAVWIGPKSNHAKAEKLLKTIQLKLKHKGFIVQHKT